MTPCPSTSAALHANRAVISQGAALLARLGASRYTAPVPVCFNASVGGHIRHIIEHYQGFLRGLDEGLIDYEDRPRDGRVETLPDHASALLEAIGERFHALAGSLGNRVLRLRAETAAGTPTETSVLRELDFLLSHTIHHYALVAVMARLQGCEPEPSFGLAPSTLAHQRAQIACAR